MDVFIDPGFDNNPLVLSVSPALNEVSCIEKTSGHVYAAMEYNNEEQKAYYMFLSQVIRSKNLILLIFFHFVIMQTFNNS